MLYAAQNYENSSRATEIEFYGDLNRIKFILKMFKRYEKDNVINERLILNHIILLYNVFHHEAMTKMLVWKLRGYLHMLKPFLVLLNYWPEKILHVGAPNSNLIGTDISMDSKIVGLLRKI